MIPGLPTGRARLAAGLALLCALLPAGAAPRLLRIGFIGDSITAFAVAGLTPADLAARELARRGCRVQVVNRGRPGTRSEDWLPQTALFREALQAFRLAGVELVQVMLGTNDALPRWRTSPARYLEVMRAICAALRGAGFRVVLAYPPAAFPRDEPAGSGATNAYLLAYQDALRAIVADGGAQQGDTAAFNYFRDHPDLLWDGIHPDQDGVAALGRLWAGALQRLAC